MRDEDEDAEEHAQLGWDHSADPDPISVSATSNFVADYNSLTKQTHSFMHLSRPDPAPPADDQNEAQDTPAAYSTVLEPTQKLSDVQNLALFPD